MSTPEEVLSREYVEKIGRYKQQVISYMRDTLKMNPDDAFATIGSVLGLMIVASTKTKENGVALCREYTESLTRVIEEHYDLKDKLKDAEIKKKQED